MSENKANRRKGWMKSAFSRMVVSVATGSPVTRFQEAMVSEDTNNMIHYAQRWRLPKDLLSQALVTAVKRSDAECADVLIKAGADVNADGGVPLFFAVTEGNADCVRVLLDNGADLRANNGSAYKLAFGNNKKEVMKVIEEFSTHRLHALASSRRKRTHAASRS